MAGFTPDEGELLIANMVQSGGDVNRGTALELGLMTNVGPVESIVLADITEPTGGGYARIPLVDATWTNATAGGITTSVYPQQTFTVSGTNYTGAVTGYFVATTGTAPKLLYVEVDGNGPYTLNINDTYKISLNITIS